MGLKGQANVDIELHHLNLTCFLFFLNSPDLPLQIQFHRRVSVKNFHRSSSNGYNSRIAPLDGQMANAWFKCSSFSFPNVGKCFEILTECVLPNYIYHVPTWL
jgi:hypothetical protein